MSVITLDTARWPIAIFTFDGQPKEADIQFFIDSVAKIHARGEAYASIGHIKQAKVEMTQISKSARP